MLIYRRASTSIHGALNQYQISPLLLRNNYCFLTCCAHGHEAFDHSTWSTQIQTETCSWEATHRQTTHCVAACARSFRIARPRWAPRGSPRDKRSRRSSACGTRQCSPRMRARGIATASSKKQLTPGRNGVDIYSVYRIIKSQVISSSQEQLTVKKSNFATSKVKKHN